MILTTVFIFVTAASSIRAVPLDESLLTKAEGKPTLTNVPVQVEDKSRKPEFRSVIENESSSCQRWPKVGGVVNVVYQIDPRSNSKVKANVLSAAKYFEARTCIRLVAYNEKNAATCSGSWSGCYVKIKSQNNYNGGYASLCMTSWAEMVLGTGSSVGTTIHEFMHVLGFHHEHQRPDRDNHLEVNEENIEDENTGQIVSKCTTCTTWGAYDFKSIMQYHEDAFKDLGFWKGIGCSLDIFGIWDSDCVTIADKKDNWNGKGQRNGLSDADLAGLNKFYCN